MSNGPPTFFGIGEALPRTCNFLTIFVGLYLIFIEAENDNSVLDLGLTVEQLGMVFSIVGVHGVFTKPAEVGVIRKFLSFMGAVPGAFVIFLGGFYLVGEILKNLG